LYAFAWIILIQAPTLDVISINRYFAWYSDSGKTQVISLQVPTEVNHWYKTYKKPVLMTEYGAGSVAGFHAVRLMMRLDSLLLIESIKIYLYL
jgi:hypothetical protein